MSKATKAVTLYKETLNELHKAEDLVESLPRGYISRKVISGHTYYYLQWREGSHVLSAYINDAMVELTASKIAVRKAAEDLVKVLKKSLKKAERELRKAGLSEEEIAELKA